MAEGRFQGAPYSVPEPLERLLVRGIKLILRYGLDKDPVLKLAMSKHNAGRDVRALVYDVF